jgi:hypothetical protein
MLPFADSWYIANKNSMKNATIDESASVEKKMIIISSS